MDISPSRHDVISVREGVQQNEQGPLLTLKSRSTADVVISVLGYSIKMQGRPVRCTNVVPGVTMWLTSGRFRPVDSAERFHASHEIWSLLRPKLTAWLSLKSPAPHFRIEFGQGVCFEFTWDAKTMGPPAIQSVAVRFTTEENAAYPKRRLQRPLYEPEATPASDPLLAVLAVRDRLWTALKKSRMATSSSYARLPPPVRFRMTGALAAWRELHEEVIIGSNVRTLGKVLRTASLTQAIGLTAAFAQQFFPNGTSAESAEALADDAAQSATWQIMELCDGVFYEPSTALHRLLHSAYIADDVPIDSLILPCDTLCIIPEASSWRRPGGNEAIVLAKRAGVLSCACWTRGLGTAENQIMLSTLELSLSDPNKTIIQLLDEAQAADRGVAEGHLTAVRSESVYQHWRTTLDYALKMLLYLSVHDAHVIPNRAYSDAPRDFTGLGKRKRAERLAEIEELYDRYVIGPALLDEEVATSIPSEDHQREVRSHWRRPYFKMQPYGPHSTLRKLAFIGPTIVRADRLGS
jgi:hypothetical protein